MATFKTGNKAGKYFDPAAKQTVFDYMNLPHKTIHDYHGCAGVDPSNPVQNMMDTSAQFGKTTGVQLRHFILSFSPEELDDPTAANEIGYRVACHIAQEYQCVYAVHEDGANLHIHLMFNSVSYLDGHSYYGRREEFYSLFNWLKALLRRYGIYYLVYVPNR